MPRIRHVLFTTVAFFTLVFVGDRLGATIMDRVVMSTRFRYADLYQGKLPAEIIVLGNSRGLHMFHPPAIRKATGRMAANISFNALPTVLMPSLWHDYLQHHSRPELLVYEVSCVNRMNERGALEGYTTFMGHSELLTRCIAKYKYREFVASQISHLYRFNSDLTWRSLFFFRSSDQDWIATGRVTDSQLDRTLDVGVEEILYSENNVSAAKEVLSLADRQNIPVVLIVGPQHPRYLAAVPELSSWIQWLEKELDRPILDYSAAITDHNAFADHLHLNPEGAESFAERLRQDGVL